MKKERKKTAREHLEKLLHENKVLCRERDEAVARADNNEHSEVLHEQVLEAVDIFKGILDIIGNDGEQYKKRLLDINVRHSVAMSNFIDKNEPFTVPKESKEEWEPFDADKWTPDRVVKTIDRRDVRILCTDRKWDNGLYQDPYCVVGLVSDGNYGEMITMWKANGARGSLEKEDNLMMLKLPSTDYTQLSSDDYAHNC